MRDFLFYLISSGLSVKLKENPKSGKKGEFYLIQEIEKGKENILYSNDIFKHPDAIKGNFDEAIYSQLKDKLI